MPRPRPGAFVHLPTVAVLALVLTGARPATAQDFLFPVADLVEPLPVRVAGQEPWTPLWPRRIRTDRDDVRRVWMRGVDGLVGPAREDREDDGGPLPVLAASALAQIVADLAGIEADDVRVADGRLRVPADAADVAGAALATVRARLGAVELDVQLELEQLDADGRTVARVGGDATSMLGGVVSFADVKRRQVLYDYDVEIAQAASTAVPRVADVSYGAGIAARMRRLPDQDHVLVEVVARAAGDHVEPIATGHPGFGALDRVGTRLGEAGLVFRLRRGQTSTHEWTSADGGRLRLRCTVDWADTVDGAGGELAGIVRGTALLNAPLLEFESVVGPTAGEDRRLDRLIERTRARLDAVGNDDRARVIGGDGDEATGAWVLVGREAVALDADLLRQWEQETATVDLEWTVVAAPAGTEVADPGALPEGCTVLASARGPVLVDTAVCFHAIDERTFLRTWFGEVAVASRIPDPQIDFATEGSTVTLVVEVGDDGRPAFVRVDNDLRRIDALSSRPVELNVASDAPPVISSWGGGSNASSVYSTPPLQLPQDVVRIEQLQDSQHRVAVRCRLDERGVAVVRRRTALLGPDRELLTIVRATRR